MHSYARPVLVVKPCTPQPAGSRNASRAAMKLFTCSSCRQVLHFENTRCERCGDRLAYLPELQTLSSLEAVSTPDAGAETPPSEFVALAPDADGQRVRLCRNYLAHDACNWAVPAEREDGFCRSCSLNEVIPNLET